MGPHLMGPHHMGPHLMVTPLQHIFLFLFSFCHDWVPSPNFVVKNTQFFRELGVKTHNLDIIVHRLDDENIDS